MRCEKLIRIVIKPIQRKFLLKDMNLKWLWKVFSKKEIKISMNA